MRMTWVETKAAVEEEKILFFSVGSIEQHGYHLPLGVDIFLPMEVLRRVAGEVDGIIAPPVNYGYKSLHRSGGGPYFQGSIGVTGATLLSVVKDIFSRFFQQGWKHIVVLDWHLENIPFVYEGVDEALKEYRGSSKIKVIKIDNPNGLAVKYDQELKDYLFGKEFPGWEVEHASLWETSAMMAAKPELVRSHLIRDGVPPQPSDYDVLPSPPLREKDTGVFWKASLSTMEKGERIMGAATGAIVEVVRKEFGENLKNGS